MQLDPGDRLGPYAILTAIGAGGMGEVYRATDTRLGRTVAIKALPAELASDPERRERFEREAKAIAALNHPHICTLHEFDSHEGTDFLVMEHLEGESLQDRLKKGPLPLDEALQVAIQIADALDKAHRQGITHRDLKPGNIFLVGSGPARGGSPQAVRRGSPQAKLLDFGLAKLAEQAPGDDDETKLADSLTAQGTILGTFHYIAPEQLEGRQADHRADIWAFGCVVHEMVTGRKAFEGTSRASLIAAIMSSDPPVPSSVETMTPGGLDYVVRTCLCKDPDDRWQSARDMRRELQRVESDDTAAAQAETAMPRLALWQRPVPAVVAALALVALGGLAVWPLVRVEVGEGRPVRFTVTVPDVTDLQPLLAVSPDGTRIAIRGAGGDGEIAIRSLDALETVPVRGTGGGGHPAISPDGEWLAFSLGDTVMKIPLAGGPAATLAEMPSDIRSLNWGHDGRLLVGAFPGGLSEVSQAGGEPRAVTMLDAERLERGHAFASYVTGHRAAVFSIVRADGSELAAVDLDTSDVTRLGLAGSSPHYVSTGHLVYAALDGTIRAVPFDPTALAVTGDAVTVVEGVRLRGAGLADYSLSDTGRLVYVPADAAGVSFGSGTLAWVDRSGGSDPSSVPLPRARYIYPRLSPDGGRLAVGIAEDGGSDLWVFDLGRGAGSRITFGGVNHYFPIWSADGTRLTFADGNGRVNRLMQAPADGSGPIEPLLDRGERQFPTSWAFDGATLAYYTDHPDTRRDIWTLSAGDGTTAPFLVTPFLERAAVFSPDGRWLAYVSNKSGRDEVYVRPYPPTTGREFTISTAGGREPVWRRDGREIFYRAGQQLMAVGIDTDGGFRPGPPEALFEGYMLDPYAGVAFPNYDVAPDGERFVMIRSQVSDGDTSEVQLNVVLNWYDELRARVSVP